MKLKASELTLVLFLSSLTAYTLFDLSMTVMAAFLYSLIMHVGVGMQTSVRICESSPFPLFKDASLLRGLGQSSPRSSLLVPQISSSP